MSTLSSHSVTYTSDNCGTLQDVYIAAVRLATKCEVELTRSMMTKEMKTFMNTNGFSHLFTEKNEVSSREHVLDDGIVGSVQLLQVMYSDDIYLSDINSKL